MHIMGYMILLFCVCVLSFGLCEGVRNMTENKKFQAINFFGDSMVDTGNNNQFETSLKANFPPYGKNFKGGVPTGRFSNGRVLSDCIAQKLGIKDVVPPYLNPCLSYSDMKTGVSFGSAGSGYDPQTSQQTKAISLSKQLELFNEYIKKLKEIAGEEEADDIIAKSLHAIVAGSFDVFNYFKGGPQQVQYSIYEYADLLASNASFCIEELYKLGARKLIVINVPPVGCTPAERTQFGGPTRMCVEKLNQGVEIVNEKLYSKTKSLITEKLAQAKVCYVELYKPTLDLIKNPESYGFEDVERACCHTGTTEIGLTLTCNKCTTSTCSNADEYLFWDGFHGTDRGFDVLAEFVYGQLKNCFPDHELAAALNISELNSSNGFSYKL